LFDKRKDLVESQGSVEIRELLPNEPVDPKNCQSFISDHFYRDFVPFALPEAIGKPLPFVDPDSNFNGKPHWFYDLPSTSMRPEPKIFLNEAMNATISRFPPICSSCQTQLVFPFMASLRYNICQDCISQGKLPPRTNTLDFFMVDEPHIAGNWTLAETNALVKKISEIGDNWTDIAAAMKTRTPGECLLHFLRLSMADPYYVTDPLSVPAGEPPEDDKMLPFMVAPDPIATFIAFLDRFAKRLGAPVAELARKRVEELLSGGKEVMLFSQVPGILRSLVELTGETARLIAKEEAVKMIQTMRDLLRIWDLEIGDQFSQFVAEIKELRNQTKSLTLS
jgi:hypothetical protein